MLQVINGTELNKTSNPFIQISTLHIISFYPFNVMVQCIFVSSFKSRPLFYLISYNYILWNNGFYMYKLYPQWPEKRCGWGWGGVNSPWGDPAPLSSCPWCCPSQTPLLPRSHSPCCRSTSVSRTTLISLHWTSLESQFMLL